MPTFSASEEGTVVTNFWGSEERQNTCKGRRRRLPTMLGRRLDLLLRADVRIDTELFEKNVTFGLVKIHIDVVRVKGDDGSQKITRRSRGIEKKRE